MTRLEKITLAIAILVILAPMVIVVQAAQTFPIYDDASALGSLIYLFIIIRGPMIVTAAIAFALYCALPRYIGGRYRTLAIAALLVFFLGYCVQFIFAILSPTATSFATFGASESYTDWYQNVALTLAASQGLSILAGAAFLVLCAVSLGVRVTRRLRRGGARG